MFVDFTVFEAKKYEGDASYCYKISKIELVAKTLALALIAVLVSRTSPLECPQHHGHKGESRVTPMTCGVIGERAQVILVWLRARTLRTSPTHGD